MVVDDSTIPNILGIQGIGPPALPYIQSSQPVPQIPELFGGVYPSSMIVNPVASIAANTLSLDTGLTLVSGQQRPLPTVAEVPVSLPVFAQPQPALRTIQPIVEEDRNDSKKDSSENGRSVCAFSEMSYCTVVTCKLNREAISSHGFKEVLN